MVPYLVLIGLYGFGAILVGGWLRKREKYVEWMPDGLDPKSKEAEPYWHRSRQNRDRRKKTWSRFFLACAGLALVVWFFTTFSIVRVGG